MRASGSVLPGGPAHHSAPCLSVRPYGREYEAQVARNVAANEGVRRLKRAIIDADEGRGTRGKVAPKPKPKRTGEPKPQFRLTPAQCAEAAAAYEAGASVRDLAAKYGVASETARNAVRRGGAKLRPLGGTAPVIDPEVVAKVIATYQAGTSARAAGAANGLGRKATARILHDAGVMREREEAARAARRRT